MQDSPLRIYSQLQTKLSAHHWINFSLTFFSVAAVTSVWKTLANVKPSLVEEWTQLPQDNIRPSSTWYSYGYFYGSDSANLFLGGLDSSFLFLNTLGLFLIGPLGDKLKSYRKWMLVAAMASSVVFTCLFGTLPDQLSFFNPVYMVCLWAINGLAQSPVIPLTMAMQANWFGKHRRGMVFGIWSTNLSVGNIMSNLMCLWSLQYGYSYCFTVNNFILATALIWVISGLTQTPEQLGLDPVVEFDQKDIEENEEQHSSHADPDRENLLDNLLFINGGASSPSGGGSLAASGEHSGIYSGTGFAIQTQAWRKRAIKLKEAWEFPGVGEFTLAYTAVKVVIYSLNLWLPYYITQIYDTSNLIAIRYAAFFDLGSIAGGICLGLIVDRLHYKSLLLSTGIITSAFVCFIFCKFAESQFVVAVLLTLIGKSD
ncbi:sugar phosphate exchanger 3-like [Symsagittifera roscoffensis]|uniref:sugar phosphate exchanger 3-like n=1 Tax=Symsagittifera roscoffensis TaxID=84072 RepID=UPI00307B1F4E